MKTSQYEKMRELSSRWYRDIRDFEFWQNLHKKF